MPVISSSYLCTVSGTLVDVLGAAVAGATVSFTPRIELGSLLSSLDGILVDPRPVVATTSATGTFSVVLLRSAASVPLGLTYTVRYPTVLATITVPDQASANLADLL